MAAALSWRRAAGGLSFGDLFLPEEQMGQGLDEVMVLHPDVQHDLYI
jgi:hypothetical protein